jgi:hypothetical protein
MPGNSIELSFAASGWPDCITAQLTRGQFVLILLYINLPVLASNRETTERSELDRIFKIEILSLGGGGGGILYMMKWHASYQGSPKCCRLKVMYNEK